MPDASSHSTFSTSTESQTQSKTRRRNLLALSLLAIALPAAAQTAGTYAVTNLISDGSVTAPITDPHFINPWGVTNATFWISAQGSGLSYVISAANATTPPPPPASPFAFTVTVPAATGGTTATGSPTGAVSIGANTGFVLPNGTKASFLFASLDGIITGWNNKLGTAGSIAQVAINNSAAGAVYTGLALATNTNGTYLLAANFGKAAAVEVYDSNFAVAKLAGSFTDPTLPANYVPYSIHTIGTQVFVAYALRGTAGPTIAPGNGMVNVFDTSGNFVAHAITPGGNLNAPWGVAIAPTAFGPFGGDLLVGNFGDGIINAYDPKTFAFLGQLADQNGKTLTYASLWELFVGLTAPSSTFAGNLNTLYITAGLTGEKHGLFAAINSNPTATGTATYGFSASASAATVAAGSSTTFVLSAVPANNFSGTVALACSGLPEAATCTFSPAQLNVTAGAPATTTLTIATVKKMACVRPFTIHDTAATRVTVALFLPFGALLLFPRRRSLNQQRSVRLLGLLGAFLVSAGFLAGCSSYSNVVVPSTPAGTSAVTIKATSGSITQSTVINLTVQ
ncbi:MAG TPA: TIGR03118 family protein [Edaphobacter sp.]|jgi:uncharacterized protein (TIGR03118 family)|nr:TIGR03118 family protein [Edaphobacter sp.]